jgi:hypothetical protein
MRAIIARLFSFSRRCISWTTAATRREILVSLVGAVSVFFCPYDAGGAPIKPEFADINPDDSGPITAAVFGPIGDCPAPCLSGGSGGRVHRLASSKGRPNEVYAASELGGLFKAMEPFDAPGFKWRHVDGHVPTKMWDVAVDPAGDIVYATSLYDGRIKSLAGIQVSPDRGATWTHPPQTPSGSCSAGRREQPSAFGIAIRPGAPNEVLVGTNCGVARSENFGATWQFIDPTPATKGVRSVFDVAALPGGLTYVCGQDGVMKSPDGKTGWQTLTTPSDSTGSYRGYCSMAVHPDFPSAIFLVFSRTTYFDPIFDIRQSAYFASFDGGQTWSAMPHPDGTGQKRVPMIAVNRRSNGLDVWLGAGNLYRMPCSDTFPAGLICPLTNTTKWKGTFTDAGGFTGFPRDLQKAHGDTGDLLFDPRVTKDARLILYSSDGGVYWNTSGGDGCDISNQFDCDDDLFASLNTGIHAQLLLGMAGSERTGSPLLEDIYMVLQDDGIFGTLNAGGTPNWEHGAGADWLDVVADATQVVASDGGQLWWADPGFVNKTTFVNAPTPGGPFFGVHTDGLAQLGPSSYVVATSTGDVQFTTNLSAQAVQDGTVAWTSLLWPLAGEFPCGIQVSNGFLFDTLYILSGPRNAGACLPRSQNQLWSKAPLLGSWKRLDTDATANQVCPNGGFGIFAADSARPGRLYASCTSEDPPRMIRTQNGGNWEIDQNLTDLMTGLGVFVPKFDDPDNGVMFTAAGDIAQPAIAGGVQPVMVAFDPKDENLLVAGGYESGVFISSDAGKGWALLTDPFTPLQSGTPHLPRPHYAHFEHFSDGSLASIYIGSVGRGVWRVDLARADLKVDHLVKFTECNGPCPPPGPCLTCAFKPGEKMDWEAEITNLSDAFAGNLVFQHKIPDGMGFRSIAAPDGWKCSTPRREASGIVRCTAGSLAPGEGARVVVSTHVAAGPGKVLASEISIVSNAIDPEPENNRVQTSNLVQAGGTSRGTEF